MYDTAVRTPDGKTSVLMADLRVTAEQADACRRLCVRNDAGDVLDMLGLDQ